MSIGIATHAKCCHFVSVYISINHLMYERYFSASFNTKKELNVPYVCVCVCVCAAFYTRPCAVRYLSISTDITISISI